jgi:CrcB protein
VLLTWFWVGLGSGLGGMARYATYGLVARLWGATFPWGTLAVNVTGSFVIGWLAAITAPEGRFLAPVAARQFLMAGVCGGFTTFSTFSLETLRLLNGGELAKALANIGASLLLCLAGVWSGYALGAAMNDR